MVPAPLSPVQHPADLDDIQPSTSAGIQSPRPIPPHPLKQKVDWKNQKKLFRENAAALFAKRLLKTNQAELSHENTIASNEDPRPVHDFDRHFKHTGVSHLKKKLGNPVIR